MIRHEDAVRLTVNPTATDEHALKFVLAAELYTRAWPTSEVTDRQLAEAAIAAAEAFAAAWVKAK